MPLDPEKPKDVAPEPVPAPPLQYATPARRAGMPYALQLVMGFGGFLAWGVLTLAAISKATGSSNGSAFWLVVIMSLFVLIVGTVLVAWRCRWPGFAVGVEIGVGLVLLGIGLCFATFAGGRL